MQQRYIFDSHHHLWCPDSNASMGYQWLTQRGKLKPFGDPTPIQRDYLLAEFIAEPKQHTLVGSVHIQTDGQIQHPLNESRWLQSVIETNRLPMGFVSFVNLADQQAENELAAQAELGGFRGVRQILSVIDGRPDISFAAEHFLRNPEWQRNYTKLSQFDASFDLQLYPEQMHEAADFFQDHPQIPIVIDHMGSPYNRSTEGIKQWHTGLRQLAKLPYCFIKISGLGMYITPWSAADLQPYFETVLDQFGSSRILFGSNFPVEKLVSDYDHCINQILICCRNSGLNDAQIDSILYKNAQSFYRIKTATD